jgi:hypothetical protein
MKKTAFTIGSLSLCLLMPLILTQCKAKAGQQRRWSGFGRAGTITTGEATPLAARTIGTSGGTIAVDKPGHPLDGLVIQIPAGSYSGTRSFTVSSAAITAQTFSDDIHPASPLIIVKAGGGYSEKLIYLRIPVKIPEGQFAMGFNYGSKAQRLEGLPLVGMDADSITVATRHFSSIFISMIEKALLKKEIDSGFQPGIDDWQFNNLGAYISPEGICEGMSLTALWYYYVHPDGAEACLYGRYDNNGNQPETPALWQDDSLGYRFASSVQTDNVGDGSDYWDALGGKAWIKVNNKWAMKDVPGISDEATRNLFAYSMRITGQPQEVGIFSNAGGGHAMICYRVTPDTLCIADPNYHGDLDREILYKDGRFKPYNSGANKAAIDAGKGKAYEKITYQANWTIVSFDKIAQRWAELKNKTIGNDKFPKYDIVYENSQEAFVPLTDGLTTGNKRLVLIVNGDRVSRYVYRDGAQLPINVFKIIELELAPGNNRLGIYVVGRIGIGSSCTWNYVDFKYINVIYSGLSIDPATLNGEPEKQYTFTAKADSPPAGAHYDWYVDGNRLQSDPATDLAVNFKAEGDYKVEVKLVDSTGKVMQEAQATAAIKVAASGSSGALAELQKTRLFRTNMTCDRFLFNEVTPNASRQFSMARDYPVPSEGDFMAIAWSGASFSGSSVNQSWVGDSRAKLTHAVKGTVAADGKTLLSLEYAFRSRIAEEGLEDSYGFTLRNVPIGLKITDRPNAYIVKMDYRYRSSYGARLMMERTLLSPPIKDFAKFQLECLFR